MCSVKPLDADTLSELEDKSPDLITVINGTAYNDEELYHCSECWQAVVSRAELSDTGLCDACVEEAYEEQRHLDQLASDFRHNVL